MNLTSLLSDPDVAVDFALARTVETVNEKGRSQLAETMEPVTGSIQPATGKEREALPDEERHKETLVVFAPVLLTDGNEQGRGADVILWQARRYRVAVVHDWMHTDGFCKALAVRESV